MTMELILSVLTQLSFVATYKFIQALSASFCKTNTNENKKVDRLPKVIIICT